MVEEEPAPAELGGFLVEIPVAALSEVMAMSHPETDFERITQPALPTWDGDRSHLNGTGGSQLVPAGRIALELPERVLNYTAPPTERRLEARELGQSTPIVDCKLGVASDTGLLKISEEPMDFLVFPHPPQGLPPLWQEEDTKFTFETQLGALARVAFGTTGLQDNEESAALAPVVEGSPAPIQSTDGSTETLAALAATILPEPPKAEPAPPPVSAEPVSQAPAKEPSRPAPTPTAQSFPRPPLVAPKAPPEAAAPKPPSAKEPELVKKPLPLTLHGLAAGRGKPVQVISTAISGGVELQVPRSTALPLRPVMILAPAAAPAKPEDKKVEEKKPDEKKIEEKRPERTVVIKTDPKKGQPVRVDPRIGNKGRKLDVPVPISDKKELDKKEPEKPATEKSTPVVVASKESTAKESATPTVEPKKPAETKPVIEAKESPQTSLYTPADLGLPSLSFQDSGNFLTRLPMPAKIAIAAGVVLAIAGFIVLGMKGGSGAVANSTPRIVSGQPLPALDSGWITDWGAEPGVRRQHEISILRPSMSITDYRLEFEAQIETKAIGWVYRAQDGKNFYVNKLEIVKPGLEPTVALVRFAVLNGEEQPRSQFPLKLPVRIDTLYKIRFDAVGDHFTTWVQDQQVDDWTDDHLQRGGVGLYNERGERMSLRGSVNVVPLAIKR